MAIAHETMLWLAKSFGLFYLIGLSLIVVAYVCWPSNKPKFDHAATAILDEDDKPLGDGPWR
jgi:cytochrome c oxidase cbb3-type subunit 4